jgi:hypothetical protein
MHSTPGLRRFLGPLLAAASLVFFALAVFVAFDSPRRSEQVHRTKSRSPTRPEEFDGRVVGPRGPIEGAVVSIQATGIVTRTNSNGQFRIPAAGRNELVGGVTLTAAHTDFLIAGAAFSGTPVTILLEPIPSDDNADYCWADPRPAAGDSSRCANCHPSIFREWSNSGHANASRNKRFQNLHDGSTWDGGDHSGWSLRDDHPNGAGVCFACHSPSALDETVASGDFSKLAGVESLGVHCDFCHKVRDVEIEGLGLTHGRDAMRLQRPAPGGEQLFFGPLADVDRGEDVFAPIFEQSHYCASCHEGTIFGMPVYTTYSEWLESVASREGKSCQSCHMASDGRTTNMAPGHGGLERSAETLSTHDMLPDGRLAMLRRAVTMVVRYGESLHVDLTTSGVGHATPTGYIDRHLLLIIEPKAEDSSSSPEPILDGPRLDSLAGEYENFAGRLFGRVVRDEKGRAPAPFWRAFEDPIDNRLPPDATTTTRWRFQNATPQIRVRLVYRRFWPSVRKTKGWPDDTLVVYDRTVTRD